MFSGLPEKTIVREVKPISKRWSLDTPSLIIAATSGLVTGAISARLTDVSMGISLGVFIATAVLVEARQRR